MQNCTCLNESREHFMFPNPATCTGCCTFTMTMISIFCSLIGYKYQLHCRSASQMVSNWLVSRALNSHAMPITTKEASTKNTIRMSSILFKCSSDCEIEQIPSRKLGIFFDKFTNKNLTNPNSNVKRPQQTEAKVQRNKRVMLNPMMSINRSIKLKRQTDGSAF